LAAARLYQRKWILIKLPIAVLAVAAMAFAWVNWLPLPPSQLTLSAGRSDGAYHAWALRYAQKFEREGVTLRVLESEGALQNLQRLRGLEQPQADLAFMQGGIGSPSTDRDAPVRVKTIARVDIEPLWMFTRLPAVDALQQLQGLRVSLGPRASGTRKVALAMLEQVRLSPKDFTDSELAGKEAADALRQGTLDVAVMIAAPQAPVVVSLLQAPGIHLVQLKRTAALTDRMPYLQTRLLPQGALDAQGKLPARDATVLTTSASLVARADLHPALQRLAAQAAHEIHAEGGVFHRPGDFPSLKRIEFPAAPEARHVLIHGRPWLEENLPFWWAQVLLRVIVICLPIAWFAFWFARLLPAYLRWLMESRVVRWYGELKYIEHDMLREGVSGLDLSKHLERLNGIEKRMAAFVTPPYLMARWFTLRQHIDFVRAGLYRQRGR
jgi:TRAP-type uncharacterized transport system substrate-binding protein